MLKFKKKYQHPTIKGRERFVGNQKINDDSVLFVKHSNGNEVCVKANKILLHENLEVILLD